MAVEISDWNDLDNVRNDLTADYVLVNDLDSETDGYAGIGDDWNPIGERAFDGDFYEGIFDGDGFGIRDLIVDDNDRSAALFAGNRGPINDLSVKAEISTTSNDFNAAILTGEARGDLSNCVVHGTVFAPDLTEMGGLAGRCADDAIISDSYSTASVEGDSTVGGLVGRNGETIQTSYATGSVEGGDDVGGLVGSAVASDEIDTYWDTEATGQDTSAGDSTGLTTAEMQGSEAETNMDGFDFTDVWDAVLESDDDTTADGYPILLSVNRDNQLESQGILFPTADITGQITLDETGVDTADVIVFNLTNNEFAGKTETDTEGNYTLTVEGTEEDSGDTIAVAVDFDDGTERYGRVVTTVLE